MTVIPDYHSISGPENGKAVGIMNISRMPGLACSSDAAMPRALARALAGKGMSYSIFRSDIPDRYAPGVHAQRTVAHGLAVMASAAKPRCRNGAIQRKLRLWQR